MSQNKPSGNKGKGSKQTIKAGTLTPEAEELMAQVAEAQRLADEANARAQQLAAQAKEQLGSKVKETLTPLQTRVTELETRRDELVAAWEAKNEEKKALQKAANDIWGQVEAVRAELKAADEELTTKKAGLKAAGLMAFEKRRTRRGSKGELIVS